MLSDGSGTDRIRTLYGDQSTFVSVLYHTFGVILNRQKAEKHLNYRPQTTRYKDITDKILLLDKE